MYCHSFLVLNDPKQIIIADSLYINDKRSHPVDAIAFSFTSKEIEITMVRTQYIRYQIFIVKYVRYFQAIT